MEWQISQRWRTRQPHENEGKHGTVPVLTIRRMLTIALGVLNFSFPQNPRNSTLKWETVFYSCDLFVKFISADLVLVDWVTFVCLFFLRIACFWGGYVSFILAPMKGTWGTLDSGIAVHSYTETQMWIGWTLHLTEASCRR